MHLKKSMLLCSLLFAVHLGTFAQTPQDVYTVKYDGNGATSGEMDDHTFAIGVEETTNLDPNSFVRSYNVSFDTQGGDSIADMKADYTFQGWIHEQLLTEITQNMEKNWFNISTKAGYDDIELGLITLSTTDGITSVSINPKGSTRERLFSQPIFMPAGDYELSFKVCSPTGYQDLTSEWEMRFKCSACDQPQTIYCNDLGLLTKGEEKSAAIIEYYEASNELVERKFTIFANDTTPVYIAINGGNIRDNVRSDFKFADFVLSKDGATSLKYTDKEPTRNIVRENGGVVELKAQWKEASIKLPTPTKEGYTFTFWNTKPDGKGKSYKGGASLKITADTKLYAMWEKGGGSGEGGCPSLNQTTQGKDFWVAFLQNCDLHNYGSKDFYQLGITISSSRACDVTIENDSLGFYKTISMAANSTQLVDIPYDDFNTTLYGEALNKTLHITSTDSISVYLSNSQYCSMECTVALPTSSCGSYYVTQMNNARSTDYKYSYSPAIFSIIAFENGTEVEITPSLKTSNGHAANEPFTVTLNRGEVYLVQTTSADEGKDFSGSQIRVMDGKKVAVFTGNKSSNVPEPTIEGDSDNLWEVCYPVSSWGQKFVVIPLKTGWVDQIKCTAAEKGATIYKNGKAIAELAPFQSHVFLNQEEDGVFILESSNPIEVYQYMTSTKCTGKERPTGGPSYQYIAPIEQAIQEINFATYDKGIDYHYLNLIIKTKDKEQVTLDGEKITATFNELEGEPNLLYTTLTIPSGSHMLKSPNGVVANMYGTGYNVSYAYSAGSNLYSINDPETITDTICEGFQYVFGGRKYTETGVYLDTITNESGCEEIKILNLTVAYPSDTTFIKDTITQGDVYKNNGFNITETSESGTKYHFLELLNQNGCDSVVCLILTIEDGTKFNNSTTLFKEDFGGNSVDDPIAKKEGISQCSYNYNENPKGGGNYAIRKVGWNHNQWYYPIYDHTYPDDGERGYLMQVDSAGDNGVFYQTQIDGLCANMELYLSIWGMSSTKTSGWDDAELELIVEDLHGNVLASKEVVLENRKGYWEQFGLSYVTPKDETSIVYKIRNSSTSSSGNDFMLDDIEVKISTPAVNVPKIDTMCVGDNLTIDASFDNNGIYQEPLVYAWYRSEKISYNISDWEFVSYGKELKFNSIKKSDAGYYKVWVGSDGTTNVNTMCNAASDIIELSVKECGSTCNKDYITLRDTIILGDSYQKNGFSITDAGIGENTYKLELTNSQGCDSIVTLYLTVKEKPSEDPDPSVPGTYTVVYDGNGATSGKMDKHVYTLGANETTQLDANQYKKVYNVTFDTQGGSSVDDLQSPCEFVGWLQEIKGDSAIYNDMANTTELVREENGIVTLKAQWEDKSIVTPFAPAKAGYTFKEWNTKADGTGDSYAAYVEVEISSDTKFYAIWVPEEELEIPTAFTPHSNDGMNDIFMEGYEVYIYDRYGDVITHSNNGWDGTYKGKTATPGVYVYVLIDKKGNSERTIKGTIEIVKAK